MIKSTRRKTVRSGLNNLHNDVVDRVPYQHDGGTKREPNKWSTSLRQEVCTKIYLDIDKNDRIE